MNVQKTSKNDVDNEAYFKIWEIEHSTVRLRWTITTFFMGISFAILGFSFQQQEKLDTVVSLSSRITALTIYWFAYALFKRFHSYNKLLRNYLLNMEVEKRTTMDIRTLAKKEFESGENKHMSAERLLLYFGLIYSGLISGLLIWVKIN